MAILRNYNTGKNVNLALSWKKFTFYFLVLSYLTYNGVYPLCKSLENIYNLDRRWNTKLNRLLARDEQLGELERTRLREKLSDRRSYTEKRNVYDNMKTYSHVKSNESNNIDIYMKNYKRRYGKKKGLSKLDCYYENKVFRKFNHIRDIAEKVQYNEKRAKKIFLRKYGTVLIFLSLIPALGFVFPILFGVQEIGKGALDYCLNKNHRGTGSTCTAKYGWYDHKTKIEIIGYFSYIFFSFFGVIVSLVFIYIMIKVIKYERIKAGRGKMNRKEYIDFCKKLLKNEKF
ncbi:Plasmodium exported protein, unknown function [Plasmodium vivax]|uniref:Variable surface protein Vir35 n=1 Tax=Plasmodium vivax TaxID=5855 RepID=A0A565A7E9_PLAVI|nr:Plasmodium exported protein, unknown function [Plasmodium vivax]